MAFDRDEFDPLGSRKRTVVLRLRKDRVPLIIILFALSYLLFFAIGFLVGRITSRSSETSSFEVSQTNRTAIPESKFSEEPSSVEDRNVSSGEYVIKIEESNSTVIPVERRSSGVSTQLSRGIAEEEMTSHRSGSSVRGSTTSSTTGTFASRKSAKKISTGRKSSGSGKKVVSGYSIQVASFKSKKGAVALVEKLKKRGYPVYYKKAVLSGGTFWRVRVGPFSSMALALKTRSSLIQEGYADCFLVRDKVYR